MNRFGTLAGPATAACLGFALLAGPALAGPCEGDIAELARQMTNPTGKGSGTLSGNTPGAIEDKAPMPVETQTGPTGKEQGTLAGNAPGDPNKVVDPTGGIATSAQDIQLQQAGLPTTAQGGDPRELDAQRGGAMAALDKARELDARNDSGCTAAVEEAREQFRKGT
jgi:hypothetical protein